MILVILGISILMLVGGIIWGCIDEWYGEGESVLAGIGGIFATIAIIVLIILGVQVSNDAVIDQKIEMYQSENQKIETQIAEIVEQYKIYESETFENFKPENSVLFASIYPELKSNELVSNQILVYTRNNEKIKELKEQKITASVFRWWLYFGGDE
jgi:preprotein translocase subunit SecF